MKVFVIRRPDPKNPGDYVYKGPTYETDVPLERAKRYGRIGVAKQAVSYHGLKKEGAEIVEYEMVPVKVHTL